MEDSARRKAFKIIVASAYKDALIYLKDINWPPSLYTCDAPSGTITITGSQVLDFDGKESDSIELFEKYLIGSDSLYKAVPLGMPEQNKTPAS